MSRLPVDGVGTKAHPVPTLFQVQAVVHIPSSTSISGRFHSVRAKSPTGFICRYFAQPDSYSIDRGSSPAIQAGTYYLALVNFSPTAGLATVRYSITIPTAGQRPVVNAQSGIVNGASYQANISSAGWMTIFGQKLASTTRTWGDGDFNGANLPTRLDDVTVLLNGRRLTFTSSVRIKLTRWYRAELARARRG
jgi:hypothetical protein